MFSTKIHNAFLLYWAFTGLTSYWPLARLVSPASWTTNRIISLCSYVPGDGLFVCDGDGLFVRGERMLVHGDSAATY